MNQKIHTIIAVETVDYSKRLEAREEGLVSLAGLCGMMHAIIELCYGHVPDWGFDKTVAGFERPVEAASAAIEIQNSMQSENEKRPGDKQILFRIGIDIGETTQNGGAYVGRPVAVAEQLASIAAPGGIVMSSAARDAINASYGENESSIHDGIPPLENSFVRSAASYNAARAAINRSFYDKGERSIEGGSSSVRIFERAPSLAMVSQPATSSPVPLGKPVIVRPANGRSYAALSFLLFLAAVALLWFLVR